MSESRNSIRKITMITEAEIEQFQADGAIVLKGLFDSSWVEKVKEGIAKNLANPSKYSENLKGPTGTGFYFNDYCNWTTIPEFKDYVYNSPVAEVAGRLMKSKYAAFYHEHVLTKDAGTYKPTPWHHDQAYYPVDGFKNCSIWMPVDAVPSDTTIQFIRGSHRWGRWFHPRKFETTRNYEVITAQGQRKYEDVLQIENNMQEYDILQWPVEPGDCVAFHMLTLHAAPSNTTSSPRRVLSTRWLGDDCVLAERPWRVSPPITGGLQPGELMSDSEIFPVIWRS